MAGSLTDARVLLADPSGTRAGKVRSYLGEDGHQTQHVKSGGEALALAQSEPFDLLIVSLHLGNEDGLRLCSQFRSHDEPRHVPILLLLAEEDLPRLPKGLEIGDRESVGSGQGVDVRVELDGRGLNKKTI